MPLTPRLFADDTCLILQQSSLSALEKACSDELIQLKDWCDANKIQINPNKSCILHLPPKQNTPTLTFQIPYDNSFIGNSICCKYLGIVIDNKLNFKQHIQLVESKIPKSVRILNKLRHISLLCSSSYLFRFSPPSFTIRPSHLGKYFPNIPPKTSTPSK